MITTNGKNVIKRFFARQVPQIAGSMAFGTSSSAPVVGDVKLGAEVLRVPISSIGADLDNNRIVFKAVIPAGTLTTISEIGLYSSISFSSTLDPAIIDPSNVLVSRGIFVTPQAVDADVDSEVEYSLGINIT